MSSKLKKATFSLPQEVLAALDVAMAQKAAPSKNAFVERALLKALKELQRQQRRVAWEAAMQDPLFLKDIAEIETGFRWADSETIQGVD